MNVMKLLVTGGAGFIGSHLVDELVKDHEVTVLDNLSAGVNYTSSKAELLELDLTKDEIPMDFDAVWHLAANPDVRLGAKDTRVHLDQNVMATYRLLEAMREHEVPRLFFTSTSTVYGEATQIPTKEDYGPLLPISLYGASKLACEALISSYCFSFGMKAVLYRFANVVGGRSTHGVTPDFVKKLKDDPEKLVILGDGTQMKSYFHVLDCVSGMLLAAEKQEEQVLALNIGSEDWIDVTTVADIVSEELRLSPEYEYTGGKRGWKGDVPKMQLDIERIKSMGWKPRYDSAGAIRKTVQEISSSDRT